jgi:hypothetical protein
MTATVFTEFLPASINKRPCHPERKSMTVILSEQQKRLVILSEQQKRLVILSERGPRRFSAWGW